MAHRTAENHMAHCTAIFGGTFNPPHYGHLRIAEEAREKLKLERVLFVPSNIPPLKSAELAGIGHRLEMVRLSVEGNPSFEVSDIECRRGGKSFTVDTLEEIKCHGVGERTLFLLGVDAFLDISDWYRHERLLELTDFIVVNRPPYDTEEVLKSPFVDTARGLYDIEGVLQADTVNGGKIFPINCTSLDISASDIRRRLRKGLSVKYLLPEDVESYIISNTIYGGRQL